MKKLFCMLLLVSAQPVFAQDVVTGIYGASNAVNTPSVSLDWQIGSLVPTSLSPFPVRLISFEGKRNASGAAELHWKTAEETSNEGFEIQKSVDGKTSQKIGWLDGSNTDMEKEYTFTDHALTETSYYRLKQIDYSGSFTLSRIVVVVPENESMDRLLAYPVPTDDGHVTVSLPDKTLSLRLVDIKGSTVLSKTLPPGKIAVYLPASGLYLLHVQTKTETGTIKLLRK